MRLRYRTISTKVLPLDKGLLYLEWSSINYNIVWLFFNHETEKVQSSDAELNLCIINAVHVDNGRQWCCDNAILSASYASYINKVKKVTACLRSEWSSASKSQPVGSPMVQS